MKQLALIVFSLAFVFPFQPGFAAERRQSGTAALGEAATAQADEQAAVTPSPELPTPTIPFAFKPLPLGQVEPAGWLRDWAEAMRDGITGELDGRSPVFADGWKGVDIKGTHNYAEGIGWPLEQSAYWLDGAIRLGYILKDADLIGKIHERLYPVVDGVLAASEGTSFVYWKENWTPRGFDCWAQSHMGRALVALYDGSGDQKVLDALVKVYSNYSTDLGPLHFKTVSGLCNLDPMMETYARSGDARILDRAKQIIAKPEARTLIRNWSEGRFDPGHLVITYENIRVPAVMYPWTGIEMYRSAPRRAFEWLDEEHMLPYGLPSGEEYVAGIGAGRKTETCNIAALLMAAHWMYRIDGDGSWGDRMERAFFNAAPGALSRDCTEAVYYQTPNRIQLGVHPVDSPHPGADGISYGPLACKKVLCCIGASNRIIPGYIANMWMSTADRGLAATLYGPSVVNSTVGDGVSIRIACETAYPFEESIRMTVEPEKTVGFPLYLRIPEWCAEPVVTVNQRRVKAGAAPDKAGFMRLERRWRKGDVVELSLPMGVRVERGLEGPYPSQLRRYFRQVPDEQFEARALPYASVSCGPLLFALPIQELDANTPAKDVRWNYALDLHPDDAGAISVARSAMPPRWDWPADAPLTMTVPAKSFDWNPRPEQALPEAPVAEGEAARITLVPYACAKFQISMFPVTARAWEGFPVPELPAPAP